MSLQQTVLDIRKTEYHTVAVKTRQGCISLEATAESPLIQRRTPKERPPCATTTVSIFGVSAKGLNQARKQGDLEVSAFCASNLIGQAWFFHQRAAERR